ncbi:unnamed protein product [Mytilus coruscus]|uniref:Uncharacterized protein n=1 Tax=Mytilus coruscus TaxID=42192 RepID=A0A6J8DB84_MYTCO|nr:unnamed protein product [Mytilus coruscus]
MFKIVKVAPYRVITHLKIHDKNELSDITKSLSTMSDLICTTVLNKDENLPTSNNGRTTELHVDQSKTLSTSIGSSEISKTLSTSMGSSVKSKTLSTIMGSSEMFDTPRTKRKCKLYDYQSLVAAYNVVKDGGMSMCAACKHFLLPSVHLNQEYKAVLDDKLSKIHGVLFQTLRDRVAGDIDPECTTMGNAPLFTLDEEIRFVTHLMEMAELGYGYYRQGVLDIATDYAISLDKKTNDENPLSLAWFYGILGRWPDLNNKGHWKLLKGILPTRRTFLSTLINLKKLNLNTIS